MKKLLSNFLYVFLAQGVVLLLSAVFNFVVPKVLGKEEFGYWQFFLLLTNYVGFFTLGFSDGIYLKEGGKKYNHLNFNKITQEVSIFIIFQFFFAGFIFLASFFFKEHSTILRVLAFYLFFQNLSNFFGLLFQAVGEFKKYAFSVLVDKCSLLVLLFIVLFFGANVYVPYIIIYTIGKILSLAYYCYNVPEFLKVITLVRINTKGIFKRIFSTICIGINIMLANILGSLIIGGGRFIIEHKWGIQTFGEVSLSFSFTFLFLLFVTQIGLVLFPMLKQLDERNMEQYYDKVKTSLDVVLPLILILYFPFQKFLSFWLPQYTQSIRYLIILLPICLYEGRFHVLSVVFFKALRYERKLLAVNAFTCLASILLCLGFSYLFDNLIGVLIALVFAIIGRALVSEFILSGKKVRINDAYELLLIGVFIVSNWYLNIMWGLTLFGAAIALYYVYNQRSFRAMVLQLTSWVLPSNRRGDSL